MERFGSAGEPIWRDPETHTYSCSAGCAVKLFVFSSQVEGAERVGWADRGLVWSGGMRVPQEIKIGIKGHEISSEMPPMGIALQEA